MVTFAQSIEEQQQNMDRIQQLQEAHPWISKGECHLILVYYYKNFKGDHDSESFEESIQAYTDHLCEVTEYYLKNVIATAFEHTTMSRAELLSLR